MGTRLYPNTNNPVTLEKLAGVPAGTYSRWNEFKLEKRAFLAGLEKRAKQGEDRQKLFFESNDFAGEQYDKMSEDEDVSHLDRFILFGWGKIQFAGGDSGEHTDAYNVDQVLFWQGVGSDDLNGVTLEELEGVHWC
jgi:hypothetical protein